MNLSELIEGTLLQLRAQPGSTAVGLASTIVPHVTIMGDGEKIHQAVLNLLLNALHASGSSGQVTVSLAQSDKSEAVLRIGDQGRGIAPEDLPRIFEPFFTTKSSGSGLGLAIVKGIVEDHHGRIEVSSLPGRGAEFTVYFPLA